jgi:hypothetical protein
MVVVTNPLTTIYRNCNLFSCVPFCCLTSRFYIRVHSSLYVKLCKQKDFMFSIFNMQVGERILCRHPFNESKRAYVVPQRIEELLKCYWSGSSGGSEKHY